MTVAIETASDFDLGPLSWVQGEIDEALSRGLEALAAFKSSPKDLGSLKHARMHVHQAAGAIQMVGLDAVVAFTDEIERQLERLEEAPAGVAQAACDAIDRACRKLRIFLDELVNGVPPVPLKLFPEYETMQRQRGVKAASPTDLFYPDLSPRAPKLSTPQPVPPAKLQSYMVKQRRHYQRGLLAWLRGDEEGAKVMRDAVTGIEDITTHANLRAFWWTTGALLDALTERGLESSFGVKQLAARIDLQIRRVVEGSAKVADRLRREVLYYVAISAPVAPSVQAVQRGFTLSGLIPTAEVLNADLVRIRPLLREAREQLGNAKDSWLKFTSGRAENLPKLKQTLTSVHKAAVEMGNGALMKLTSSLVERLDKMPGGTIAEPLAMEYATGILLAESAFENYAGLATDFPKQVETMLARLDAARASRPIPAAAAPVLDEMAKRAQERLLLAQVGREIQANLRHMEQVLDAFFRDSAKRAELATLAKDSSQIRGALRILGLDDAEQLLGLCQAQIEAYAHPDAPVSNDDLELLAESLSGLGFYIEAVEQQRPDRDRLIAPLLAKRLGVAPVKLAEHDDSVEAAVAEMRSALPDLVAQVHRAPSDAAARDSLYRKLASLRDDAELIGDADLTSSAEAALKELQAGGSTSLDAVTALAESGAATPAPEISAETLRLLATDATALDAELVDIYLAEAHEVLDTVATHHAMLVRNPGDREALRTVRRGFHTLKGSGRMVGLTGLGEIAYDVEKILNRLLEEERPVTSAVVAMIGVAQSSFRRWIGELTDSRRVAVDASDLHAAIRAVENELPGNRDSVLGSAPMSATVTTLTLVESSPPVEPELREPDADEEIEAAPPPLADVIDFPELGTVHPAPAPRIEPIDEGRDGGDDGDIVLALDTPSYPSAPYADATPSARFSSEEDNTASTADEIDVGGVRLSASLYGILVEEADQHLATLAHELTVLQFDPAQSPSAEMVRASHTLCGIHRTGGFPLVATAAKALEQCLLGLQDHAGPRPGFAPAVLARAVAGLMALVARVKSRTAFTVDDRAEAEGIVNELEELRQETAAEHVAHDAESVAERVAAAEDDTNAQAMLAATSGTPSSPAALDALDTLLPEIEAPAPALAQVIPITFAHAAIAGVAEFARVEQAGDGELPAPATASEDESSFDDVHDDIDEQVLPIFLEEAAELFPQAGDELRAWRRAPEELTHAQQLRRTLHTFKGSARMAGALRLGELTHRMESRLLDGDELAHASPELFDALDTDLDHVAFVLDALRKGRSNVALPWLASVVPPIEPEAPVSEAPIAQPPVSVTPIAQPPAAAEPIVVPIAPPPVSPSPIAVPIAQPPAASDPIVVPNATPSVAPPQITRTPTAPTPVVVPIAPHAPQPAAVAGARPTLPPPAPAAVAPRAEAADNDPAQRAMLRVRADMIDRLVNEAGEVAITRARVEGELRSLKANLLELTGSVIRLRTQVREVEIQAESQIQSRMSALQEAHGDFDPLELDRFTRFQELTRSLAEGVNDVSTVQQSLLKNLDDADAALLAQARISREVQQQLFSIRTVPFGSLSDRLYRIMRQTSKELDKRANLEIHGAQTELDRSVLEKLVGPLEHLLRNALDHGIEAADERVAAAKPETGEIALTVRQVGNEIAIEIADDGAGLDLDDIRAKAVAQGKLAAQARPTDAQLIELIFHPGFTTASKVTQISGRGIGMDVVRSEIAALGGRVEVTTERGRGTRFLLYLPLTLAVAQAVLVRAGGRLWALPSPMVEQVQQVKADVLVNLYVHRSVEWQGRSYPFHYLPRLLGDNSHSPETARYNPVLLLRAGHGLAAIHVDEMVGNQEVVVKNIGPQLARVSGIAGATVLGTGEIVLIINPVQLAQRTDVPVFDPDAEERIAGDHLRPQAAAGRPLVMVVDDSLTVRKITSRLLVREGFDVTTAKDGVDALQLLGEQTPDVILLDIEMPRMDGFEFTKTIKSDPKFSHIPIVMITSRTAEKHRNRAKELGVDLYLGKPFQEEQLVRNLREMLEIATPA